MVRLMCAKLIMCTMPVLGDHIFGSVFFLILKLPNLGSKRYHLSNMIIMPAAWAGGSGSD